MSYPIIFYSWQSDLPRVNTRNVIHAAAVAAIERVAKEFRLEDAPRLDHDTLGESGAPAITETIFRKIKECALFLADVSFVGKTEARDGSKAKKLPNPNVLLELGFAAATIGWSRVLLVMNKHYGSPESLPFDLRSRRFPITFVSKPEQDTAASVAGLADQMEPAIRQFLASDYERVEDALSRLTYYSRQLLIRHGVGVGLKAKPSDNRIASSEDLSILQLLELGLIRCTHTETDEGLLYLWTYLGRQCCARLGAGLIHLPPASPHLPVPLDFPITTTWDSSAKEPVPTEKKD